MNDLPQSIAGNTTANTNTKTKTDTTADTTIESRPMKSEDKRAAELEELRKKQLAKTKSNNIEDSGKPMAMDSFLEQQREQTKLRKLQKQNATENLRNYKPSIAKNPSSDDLTSNKNTNTSTIGTPIHSTIVKEQLMKTKQKQLEATENLRNYRTQPENLMTHEVKKHAKVITNKNIVVVEEPTSTSTAPSPTTPTKKKLETVEGQFVRVQQPAEDGMISLQSNNTSTERDRSRSESQGTEEHDWSVVSGGTGGNDSNSDAGLSYTAVNVDISELSNVLSSLNNTSNDDNGADAAAGAGSSASVGIGMGEGISVNSTIMGMGTGISVDTNLSTSYVDASTGLEMGDEKDKQQQQQQQNQQQTTEKVNEKAITEKWTITNVSVSFGLLIHENDAPPEGSFSSPIQNEIVDNLMFKMRLIAEKSLEEKNFVKVVDKQDEGHPLTIKVQRDVNYKAPVNRPGVRRNLIKATIPINAIEGDLQGLTNAKALVYHTLRKSLSDLTSRS
jgi:hypothetical protein